MPFYIKEDLEMSLPKQYLNKASEIEHQRGSNWCTNHAVSSLLEAQFARVYGNITPLSNSWAMMLSKKVDGRPDATGTPIEKLMDQVCKYGMCTEALYPTWDDKDYNDNKFLPTTEDMYEEAKKYKPSKRVDMKTTDVEAIKKAILNKSGCIAIVSLYKEHTFPIQGCVVKPAKGSEPDGLHAIWLCGYIEDMPKTINGVTYKNWFIMQESYGTTRGYKGYLFVPYEAFTEKWTGLYSVDTYLKSLHTFESDSKLIKYPNFHKSNRIDFPCTTIELKVGSKSVQVNKVEKVIDYPVTVEQGTTLVPFRFLCEALGYTVKYSSSDKVITAYSKMHNQLITMQVGSNVIKSEQGGKVTYAKTFVPVKVVSGYTLIPLRAFAELTGAKVDYTNKRITVRG